MTTDPVASALAILSVHRDFRVLRRAGVFELDPHYEPTVASREILVLDTETTGLDPKVDGIVEIGLVRAVVDESTGKLLAVREVYGALEDPGIPISPEASAVNGITNDDVRGKRIDDDVVLRMLAESQVVIAHNAGFDRKMAEARWPQFEQAIWACSLVQPGWTTRGFTGSRQEWLAFQMGYFYEAHRAVEDCLALLTVLSHPHPEHGPALTNLLDTPSAYRLWATGAPFEVKDTLKAAGYEWMPDDPVSPKTWALPHIEGEEALEQALAWLFEHGYRQNRRAAALVERIDGRRRYSSRTGELIRHTFG